MNTANLLISAIIMGLLFLNRKNEQIDTRIKFGLLFFVTARTAFNSLAGIPILFFERNYFYRYVKNVTSKSPYSLSSV